MVLQEAKGTCFSSSIFPQISKTATKSQSKTSYPSTSQLTLGGYGSASALQSQNLVEGYQQKPSCSITNFPQYGIIPEVKGLILLWNFHSLNQIVYLQKIPHFSPLIRFGLLLQEKWILARQVTPKKPLYYFVPNFKIISTQNLFVWQRQIMYTQKMKSVQCFSQYKNKRKESNKKNRIFKALWRIRHLRIGFGLWFAYPTVGGQ